MLHVCTMHHAENDRSRDLACRGPGSNHDCLHKLLLPWASAILMTASRRLWHICHEEDRTSDLNLIQLSALKEEVPGHLLRTYGSQFERVRPHTTRASPKSSCEAKGGNDPSCFFTSLGGSRSRSFWNESNDFPGGGSCCLMSSQQPSTLIKP